MNGYLLDCIIYTRAETHSNPTYAHLTKTTQIVMNLVTPYLDKGYHLYTNLFYSSVSMSKELESRYTKFTGTINNTRVDLPQDIRGTRNRKFNFLSGGHRAFHSGRLTVLAYQQATQVR